MHDELEPKIMTGWVLDGPRVDASLTNVNDYDYDSKVRRIAGRKSSKF
jgi:hypothetical protein